MGLSANACVCVCLRNRQLSEVLNSFQARYLFTNQSCWTAEDKTDRSQPPISIDSKSSERSAVPGGACEREN